MAVNFCPNCGKQTSQGEKFCSNCGKKLGDIEGEKTINLVNSVESVTSKLSDIRSKIPNPILNAFKGRKGLVTIGIGVVAFIIILSFNLGRQSPSDVAKEFIKETQEENYDKAEELWSKSGIEYMLSQLGDERWVYQTMRNFTHRTNGDLDEFEITKEEKYDNESTMVYAKFIFDNGKRSDARLQMVKEDGEWKVYAFESE
ncbi:zinc ribbon domain-containing protein [Neobacillus kokaensis]|uniref:Zinc-ribbon domain-containing protein n=1 Tax=Neobacillus kokaensis TaxID=2759023 RepID=A0ABQ3N3J2_9BACI|nr:zinc ribbon domain-containing protein [Neobacillus kokaensis]GHH98646.1 hypothetical protein AM1BK_21890 [Neobacillus kokaensis]